MFSYNLSFQLSSAFFLIVLLFHGLNPRFNPKLLMDMQTFLLGKVFSSKKAWISNLTSFSFIMLNGQWIEINVTNAKTFVLFYF